MTEPAPPTQEPPQDEDEASLLPALLAAHAAYLAWRGAHSSFQGHVLTVIRDLSLPAMVGNQLLHIAARALDRQRQAAGRNGDQLWEHAAVAEQQAAEVGLHTLAEALLWTDSHTRGDPSTSDSGDAQRGEATVPTAADPPFLLAGMVATAVANAAQTIAATLAGWATKTWVTRGDERVRLAHARLQGTTVLLHEPFVTGGHKLQYPGDPSAPIGLRANCRCSLTFGAR